jgi:hypothetical protein
LPADLLPERTHLRAINDREVTRFQVDPDGRKAIVLGVELYSAVTGIKEALGHMGSQRTP